VPKKQHVIAVCSSKQIAISAVELLLRLFVFEPLGTSNQNVWSTPSVLLLGDSLYIYVI
jgi:hypothetical protein